jgi:hypothetical protein
MLCGNVGFPMATAWDTTAPRTEAALPDWLVRIFALDVRGLVALRIGMAGLLLVDLAVRARDLVAHYTDAGVLPRAARIAMKWDFSEPWWMSLHMLSGSAWWQATLFTIAAIAAAMLLFGYRTRASLFVSWLLLFSLHARFPLLTQGGDALLRCMLFWSLFLPLTKSEVRGQGSGDRGQGSGDGRLVCSVGTVAFVVQLAVMYLFTAMLKTGPSWRYDFSATYYALSIDHFTSELGYVLLSYPRLLQALTLGAILLEWIGPLLLLIPIQQTWVRIIVPLSFIGFHLGLAATMDLGTFPWICILFWAALLPSTAWDWLEQMLTLARECLGLGTVKRVALNTASASQSVALIGSGATNAIAAFFLGYIVLMNINRLAYPRAMVGTPPLSTLGQVTGLDQYWNMFSPGPYRFGGWLRIEGETADGRVVNLYRHDEPLPESKPANVSATYSTQYWRRCLVTMYEFKEESHIEGGLRYFARLWNESHDPEDRIVRSRLIHMVEHVPPPFESTQPREIERRELGVVELSPH